MSNFEMKIITWVITIMILAVCLALAYEPKLSRQAEVIQSDIQGLPTLAEKTEILTLIDQVKKGTIPPDKVERYFELLNKYSDKTISVDKQNIIKKVNDKLKEKLK
jgi:hypothetical protein